MKRFLPLLFVLFFSACPSTGKNLRQTTPEWSDEQAVPVDTGANDTLIECINKSVDYLTAGIPNGTILGVIKISSSDADEAEFAEEQLIFCFVQTGRYRVVERKDLDIIRREQNFQLSGDVDDETAVSIGRMAGARIVITGTILSYGSSKYLNTKAIDVEAAQIRAMSSRSFSSLF